MLVRLLHNFMGPTMRAFAGDVVEWPDADAPGLIARGLVQDPGKPWSPEMVASSREPVAGAETAEQGTGNLEPATGKQEALP